jgi:hypothetical protein
MFGISARLTLGLHSPFTSQQLLHQTAHLLGEDFKLGPADIEFGAGRS